jgi:hypothetical protein
MPSEVAMLNRKSSGNGQGAAAGDGYAAAEARWQAADGKLQTLIDKREGIKAAFSVASMSEGEEVPARLAAMAGPYLKDASRRPDRLVGQFRDVEEAIENYRGEHLAEHELFEAAQRAETDRRALERQPAHRAAVAKMAKALEELSAGLREEMAARENLGPLPQSGYLPDLAAGVVMGAIGDYGSPAWAWAERVRALGILRGQ